MDDDAWVLRSLGIDAGQLAVAGAVRVAPAAITAGVVATIGAIALSTLFPIGFGRQLELSPGIDAAVGVLLGGGAVTLALPVVVAAVMSSRAGKRTVPSRQSGGAKHRTGLPVDASLGAGLVFGRRRASTWVGLGGAALGLATCVGVIAWVDGVDRVYREPARRGWMWGVVIGNVNFVLEPQRVEELMGDALLSSSTAASFGGASFNGEPFEVLAFDHHGSAPPGVARGRAPASPSEVALGAGVLDQLGVAIGDVVTFSIQNSEFPVTQEAPSDLTMTVVGEAMAPVLGTSNSPDIGVVPLDAVVAAGGDATAKFVLAPVAGPDPTASITQLTEELTEDLQTDVISARIVNLERVRTVAMFGALIALLVAMLATVSTIAASARSNRATLAVLSALGLGRRRRRSILTWQVAVVVALVLTPGLVIGSVSGAAAWRRVTEDLGVIAAMSLDPLKLTVALLAAAFVATAATFWWSRQRGTIATALSERTTLPRRRQSPPSRPGTLLPNPPLESARPLARLTASPAAPRESRRRATNIGRRSWGPTLGRWLTLHHRRHRTPMR